MIDKGNDLNSVLKLYQAGFEVRSEEPDAGAGAFEAGNHKPQPSHGSAMIQHNRRMAIVGR